MGTIWRQTRGVVAAGPFAGMHYIRSWGGSHFTQKVLGTYEKELWAIVDDICGRDYDVIVDIGAAEGYYACGLAFRSRGARIAAFEAQEQLHPALRRIASENGLADRIALLGRCDRVSLKSVLAGHRRAIVVCDVDGFEYDLLDPGEIPSLLGADLLVEVHDGIRPGVTEAIASRFAANHAVTHVAQRERTLEDLPGSISMDHALAVNAMDEGRGDGNDWLWLEAKPRAASEH